MTSLAYTLQDPRARQKTERRSAGHVLSPVQDILQKQEVLEAAQQMLEGCC